MRPPRIRLAVAVVAFVLALALLPTPAQAAVTRTIEYGPVSLGPGMTFTRYKQVGAESGDTLIRRPMVIEIDPSQAATIDLAMPGAAYPGSKLLSAMVPQHTVAGTTAVAGINGDFGLNGRAFHALMQDGYLWQTGVDNGPNFAIRKNEAQAFVGKARVAVSVLDQNGLLLFPVDRWNSTQAAFTAAPHPGEIDGYSPEGGSLENPPTNSCSARLVSPGPLTWTAQRKAITRTYTVNKVKCTDTTASLPENGGVVVSAPKGLGSTQQIAWIKALVVGQTVQLRTGMGWNGVADSIGGDPVIVDFTDPLAVNGITPGAIGATCTRTTTVGCKNPRTAVGINQACAEGTTGCRIWFVVVDGRQGSWSAGFKLSDMAELMKFLGAYKALNLDGGGSSGMWIEKSLLPDAPQPLPFPNPQNGNTPCQVVSNALNPTYGCFVSRPSTDGTHIVERTLESALVLLDGPDTFPTNPEGGGTGILGP